MNGRWIVAFLVGIPLALAVGATLLPRVGPHEIMRHQVSRLIEEIFPAPVKWDRVEISIDPPQIEVLNVSAGIAESSPVQWRIANVRLEVDPEPLRRGLVRVREVAISQPQVDWLRLPGNEMKVQKEEADASVEAVEEADGVAGAESFFDFALLIEDGKVRLGDGARDFSRAVVFEKVQLRLEPKPPASHLRGSARIAPDALISGSGWISAAGDFELNVEVANLDLALLAHYVGDVKGVSGTVSGPVLIRGTTGRALNAMATLRGDSLRLSLDSFELDGPMELLVTLEADSPDAVRGRLSIEAGDAVLVVHDAYRKPPGVPASIRGDFTVGSDDGLVLGEFDMAVGKKTGAGS